jgi:hypothetical protein
MKIIPFALLILSTTTYADQLQVSKTLKQRNNLMFFSNTSLLSEINNSQVSLKLERYFLNETTKDYCEDEIKYITEDLPIKGYKTCFTESCTDIKLEENKFLIEIKDNYEID